MEVFPIKNQTGFVTLKGIIIPIDWDKNGNATAIAISTHGEEEYPIFNNNKGKKLFKFIQDSVKVRGKIVDVAGIKIIKINEMERCILIPPDEINNFKKPIEQRK